MLTNAKEVATHEEDEVVFKARVYNHWVTARWKKALVISMILTGPQKARPAILQDR